MGNELTMSDSVDPFHATWGISLFPRTARALTDADLPSENKDLDSVHHFMKYLVLVFFYLFLNLSSIMPDV